MMTPETLDRIARRMLDSPYALGIIVAAIETFEHLEPLASAKRPTNEALQAAFKSLHRELVQRPHIDNPYPEPFDAAKLMGLMFEDDEESETRPSLRLIE